LALLRVAQDRVDLAAAAARRVMSVTTDPLQRTLPPAHVEILLAASEIGERAAVEELDALADRCGGRAGAMAQHAKGAVALADGDARARCALRRAQEVWQRVGRRI
jgi:hypothetical protein